MMTGHSNAGAKDTLDGNVNTRLQALFPTTETSDSPKSADAFPSPVDKVIQTADSKALKIRIITWNMQSSLPKGSLDGLLGRVPRTWDKSSSYTPHIPHLPLDEDHPHHLVVIAGQECPTATGIMPLGLGGFKLGDKEKEKEKEKEREFKKESKKMEKKSQEEEASHIGGWTAILDDWFCGSSVSSPDQPSSSPETTSPSDGLYGPYIPLIKQRMMGLYLAVYCHRQMKGSILGSSKSAVTAGLIGGRVGNKGGVGISLNVNGTSFLFLNAHLAAHEGKVQHRMANLAKIKAELSVDDFLQPTDPRTVSEDITDRFDFSFLFGDLNFRLDVSRLHADWLIARRDYTQALAFDQLRNLMTTTSSFLGFHEAPIDFPPTFKYDIMHTFKGHKAKKSLEKLSLDRSQSVLSIRDDADTQFYEDDDEGRSFTSLSTRVSTSSRRGVAVQINDNGSDGESEASPLQTYVRAGIAIPNLSEAALRTKLKIKGILSPIQRRRPVVTTEGFVSSLDQKSHYSPNSPSTRDVDEMRLSTQATGKADASAEDDDRQGVYDSSHKKRVPSWCDRILWKTTIQPDNDEGGNHRNRNRISQMLINAFKPLRLRQDSFLSAFSFEHKTPLDSAPINQSNETPILDQLPGGDTGASTDHPYADLRLPRSATLDDRTAQTYTLKRSISVDVSRPENERRGKTFPLEEQGGLGSQPVPKWRLFLPSFGSEPRVLTMPDSPSSGRAGRRGDVVCTSYDTLDDKGMRKLEGRSDHRPVMGTYVIYT